MDVTNIKGNTSLYFCYSFIVVYIGRFLSRHLCSTYKTPSVSSTLLKYNIFLLLYFCSSLKLIKKRSYEHIYPMRANILHITCIFQKHVSFQYLHVDKQQTSYIH